jgi:hypothetical protein
VFHASQLDGIPGLALPLASKAVSQRIEDVKIIMDWRCWAGLIALFYDDLALPCHWINPMMELSRSRNPSLANGFPEHSEP